MMACNGCRKYQASEKAQICSLCSLQNTPNFERDYVGCLQPDRAPGAPGRVFFYTKKATGEQIRVPVLYAGTIEERGGYDLFVPWS